MKNMIQLLSQLQDTVGKKNTKLNRFFMYSLKCLHLIAYIKVISKQFVLSKRDNQWNVVSLPRLNNPDRPDSYALTNISLLILFQFICLQ